MIIVLAKMFTTPSKKLKLRSRWDCQHNFFLRKSYFTTITHPSVTNMSGNTQANNNCYDVNLCLSIPSTSLPPLTRGEVVGLWKIIDEIYNTTLTEEHLRYLAAMHSEKEMPPLDFMENLAKKKISSCHRVMTRITNDIGVTSRETTIGVENENNTLVSEKISNECYDLIDILLDSLITVTLGCIVERPDIICESIDFVKTVHLHLSTISLGRTEKHLLVRLQEDKPESSATTVDEGAITLTQLLEKMFPHWNVDQGADEFVDMLGIYKSNPSAIYEVMSSMVKPSPPSLSVAEVSRNHSGPDGAFRIATTSIGMSILQFLANKGIKLTCDRCDVVPTRFPSTEAEISSMIAKTQQLKASVDRTQAQQDLFPVVVPIGLL
jgi:hypothetical protein